jgi:hypothetical protein
VLVDADLEDVAQRRQRLGVQPLRGAGNRSVDLLPGQHHSSLGQRGNQVAGGEHAFAGHHLPQMPADRAPARRHQAPPATGAYARRRALARVRFLKSSDTFVYKAVVAA